MGKYIGRDNPYGLFEKQQITVTQDSDGNFVRLYDLNYLVSGATSVLVVCERAVLEPDVDYTILQGNGLSKLNFLPHIDLDTPADGTLSIYVVFLGKQLSVTNNIGTLGSLSDVEVYDSLASGQLLSFNGSKWSNSALSYNDLTNKPNLSQYATTSYVSSSINSSLTTLIDAAPGALNTLNELASALGNDENFSTTVTNSLATKANISSLATVATSGSYNDLSDKPTIPSLNGYATEAYVGTAIVGKADSSSLATVATSGSWDDITNKPPSLFSGSYTDLSDKPNFAAVATSGSYNDLSDKPSIPSITGLATETYVNTKVADLVASAPGALDTLKELATALGDDASFSTTVTNSLAAKANSADLATVATSGSYTDLSNKPNLATVATSGSYNDLSNKPLTLLSPQDGQILTYNAGTQSFQNTSSIDGNLTITGTISVENSVGDVSNPALVTKDYTSPDWEYLNSNFSSTCYINSVAKFDQNLYVGGTFTNIESISASNIAKYNENTSSWTALGTGVNGSVSDIVVDSSGNVFVCGYFTTAGGVSANHVAKWNGTTWSALGTGMNNSILKLAIDSSNNLYAIGYFTTAGGVAANYIAKWNGSVWTAMAGLLDMPKCIEVVNSSVYVGGDYLTDSVNYFAKWNGTTWVAVGSGVNSTVQAITKDSTGNLYIAGSFSTAGGAECYAVAKYTETGSTYTPLSLKTKDGKTTGWGTFNTLCVDGGKLYVGGSLPVTGGGVSLEDNLTSKNILVCDISTQSWTSLGFGTTDSWTAYSTINKIIANTSGSNLIVAGSFTKIGIEAANGIAKWNKTSYIYDTRVGLGTSSPQYALHLAYDSAAKPTSGYWTIASDERLKRNISPYKKGLAEILQVNPITYEHNGKGGIKEGLSGISILAQEIQPVFPECVGTYQAKLNPEDDSTTELLNYNGQAISFALINAIKELNAKVESLEQSKAELEKRLAELEVS